MHAVMSDPESVEKPCLYIQLDAGDDDDDEFYGAAGGEGTANGEGEAGSEDEGPLPELRLIPADPATCEWQQPAAACGSVAIVEGLELRLMLLAVWGGCSC
mgnify:CR=1 FL=1